MLRRPRPRKEPGPPKELVCKHTKKPETGRSEADCMEASQDTTQVATTTSQHKHVKHHQSTPTTNHSSPRHCTPRHQSICNCVQRRTDTWSKPQKPQGINSDTSRQGHYLGQGKTRPEGEGRWATTALTAGDSQQEEPAPKVRPKTEKGGAAQRPTHAQKTGRPSPNLQSPPTHPKTWPQPAEQPHHA